MRERWDKGTAAIVIDLPDLFMAATVTVTINTLYAPMRRDPVCFLLLLYYTATLPMLD